MLKINKTLLIIFYRGTFATVKLAKSKVDNQTYAVKIINKSKLGQKDLEKVSAEFQIVQKLSHPNIIKMKELIETKDEIYLFME